MEEFKSEIVRSDQAISSLDKITENIYRGILFSGDRFSCCDEFLFISDGESLLGVASIAPKGETRFSNPAIVGVWVNPNHRRKGIANFILNRAIERIEERFPNQKITIDAISRDMLRILRRLSPQTLEKVEIVDSTFC